jgi:hypothetical protein
MYDTMLFLTFVSLSGLLVLPVFYQEAPYLVSQHQGHEERVESTLHLLLTSSVKNFSYTTAGTIIDTVGETIGINTTQSSGLYPMLTTWLMGKEQHHKTYGQLLSENLATQARIPISSNSTIDLNIFTQDFSNELTSSIRDFLDETLSQRFRYNFTAIWYPIVRIPCGGCISIGPTPPSVNLYAAQQTINIPFLPVVTYGNQTIVITRKEVATILSNYIFSNDTVLKNISDLLQEKNNVSGQYDNGTKIAHHIADNITFLLNGFLTTGISFGENDTKLPGVLDWMITYFLSPITDILENSTSQTLSSSNEYSFGRFESLYTSLNSSNDNMVFSKIQEEIINLIGSSIGFSSLNFSEICHMLIQHASLYVSQVIEDILYPVLLLCAEQLMVLYDFTQSFIEILVDLIFDQLSLTSATVTLTMWEKIL